jgi:CRP-like cAMP-binding protein
MGFAPEERYPSARALKDDVERFLHGTWDLPRTFVPAGSLVVAEGEAGNTAYVIAEGRCVAYRVEGDQEIELRTMGPGDVFGELAVFLDTPRTASIRAATDATLIVVTREVLSKAVGLHSWMGAFVRALANRFREADEKLRRP